MKHEVRGDTLTIGLEGRVDSTNAGALERELMGMVDETGTTRVVLDAQELAYISSAGLRVVLRLLKRTGDVRLINASTDVYDVLEMTGMCEMMEVTRALREVSLEGLTQIGAGANGRVLRLDDERIIKVYNPISNPVDRIVAERDVSRKAFVAGIPSAISFELVRVGDSYGIIYEMIDAKTLGQTMRDEPERIEELSERMALLLRQLHATHFEPGELPDARLGLRVWVDIAAKSGYYDAPVLDRAYAAFEAIPAGDTFVHGDFHPGNIMVTADDELLLIDMGDASVGDPMVDLSCSCAIMSVMQRNPDAARIYTCLEVDQLKRAWNTFMRTYFETDDAATLMEYEARLTVLSLLRTLGGVTFVGSIPDERRHFIARSAAQRFCELYDQFGVRSLTSGR